MTDGLTPARRRRYIDWTRGLAVLIMILGHVLDAWTLPSERATPAFRNLTIVTGFAAPLFLWLAGLVLVLSAERTARRSGSRRTAWLSIVQRGLEIFILAFIFRVQAFLLSPGGWPISIFRVDILNIMGPAIVAAGLIWGLVASRGWLVATYSAVALSLAMMTPIVRTAAWVRPTADLVSVASQAGRGAHDVHAVAVGRVRLCRSRGRRFHRRCP